MKITGWQIRDAISSHNLRKDAAEKSFNGSLKKFPGEDKDSPQSLVDTLDAGLHELRAWCLERYVPFDLVDDHGSHHTVIDAVLSYFTGLGL